MSVCIKCSAELPDGAVFCPTCGKKQIHIQRKAPRRGNGGGCAYKRGKTWTAKAAGYSYTEYQDGKFRLVRQRPTKGGFRTKNEALQWAAAQGADDRQPPTLADLWMGWSNNDMLKLCESKQTAYRLARERIEPIIARRIDKLRIDDLQNTLNANAGSYYTARDVKGLLSKLYKRAMADGFVSVNLASFLVLPELEEKEAVPFSEEEVSQLRDRYNGGDVFVGYILLLIYSGMMPAELKACRKDMINRDKCEIYGCGKKTKTRKKDIPIIYPDFLAPVVDALCDYSSNEMLLPMGHNQFYDEYHAALSRAGVRDLPPYSCRHTYGTAAVKGKNSPEIVRQMLRHSTILMQQRYTHLSPEAAHAAANALVPWSTNGQQIG